MLTVISLGAGVQSSTMALMSHVGDLPRADAAIFADTQEEPKQVYEYLEWLKKTVSFPIHVVSVGSLGQSIIDGMTSGRMDARPPLFTAGGGMLRRQCTGDYKIVPIKREIRRLLGKGPRSYIAPGTVEQWVGISLDEIYRIKPSYVEYIVRRDPLVERRMRRSDCAAWLTAHGFPIPAKSACTFCPYRSNARWRELKESDPEGFLRAVEIDEIIRPGMPGPRRHKDERWYVHHSREPLKDVDLSRNPPVQLDMFNNECEGMCGV